MKKTSLIPIFLLVLVLILMSIDYTEKSELNVDNTEKDIVKYNDNYKAVNNYTSKDVNKKIKHNTETKEITNFKERIENTNKKMDDLEKTKNKRSIDFSQLSEEDKIKMEERAMELEKRAKELEENMKKVIQEAEEVKKEIKR
ncbi:MAG: hypothetical protein FH753_03655 [Firmicutes bacterium]|nr:hypothetical protein [Bacillota bacterium]